MDLQATKIGKQAGDGSRRSAPRLKRPPSALVEKGGVALVEFQLARRGCEFIRTTEKSKSGDIWAETPIGRISIEVKTTANGRAWMVSRRQEGSEIYCLVSLDEGRCYVLTIDEMGGLLNQSPDIYHGVAFVPKTALPPDSVDGWNRIGHAKMPSVGGDRPRIKYKKTRVVRHTLASGEIKTYTYPPHEERQELNRLMGKTP